LAAAWLRSWATSANPVAVAAWPGDGSTGGVDVQLGSGSASGTDSHLGGGRGHAFGKHSSTRRVLHLQSPDTPLGCS